MTRKSLCNGYSSFVVVAVVVVVALSSFQDGPAKVFEVISLSSSSKYV